MLLIRRFRVGLLLTPYIHGRFVKYVKNMRCSSFPGNERSNKRVRPTYCGIFYKNRMPYIPYRSPPKRVHATYSENLKNNQ